MLCVLDNMPAPQSALAQLKCQKKVWESVNFQGTNY